ncbi:hypothetical protein LTR17_026690 [Elasticomyces elasticus]|nr:hypothetical protein LTR17_026690 [Elasticomyces elasticus]
MATQPCYFLALPKELRLHIYDHLLRPDCVQLHSYDDELNGAGATMVEDGGVPVYYSDVHEMHPRSFHPHVLRSCRQVLNEAKAVLYAPEHLIMNPSVRKDDWINDDETDDEETSLATKPLFAGPLRPSRSLQFFTVCLCTSWSTVANDLAHSIYFAGLLEKKCVRELKLEVVDAYATSLDEAASESVMVSMEDMIKTWTATVNARRVRIQIRCDASCTRIWSKDGSGEWHEAPESHSSDDSKVTARSERLFAAVKYYSA